MSQQGTCSVWMVLFLALVTRIPTSGFAVLGKLLYPYGTQSLVFVAVAVIEASLDDVVANAVGRRVLREVPEPGGHVPTINKYTGAIWTVRTQNHILGSSLTSAWITVLLYLVAQTLDSLGNL